nr:reverse transcriptase domain-containing protein [Tanacetum cinerariifolium]
MHTCSSSNLIVESFTIPKRRNRRHSKQIVKPELRTIVKTPIATIADTRTTSELLQAHTEGYGDAIVIAAIIAKKFELKVRLLSLVTSSQFHGFETDDPHSHICWFNKITSMLKYKNVPYDAIKFMLYLFSLEGVAWTWLEKEPPRSIHTWENLVFKFVNYFFPPSKTTNLKNDITNFQQRLDETFSEAWDRFKDLFLKCPHYGFSKLHQIDTFYNALTQFDQDSLNTAAGGNLLNLTPRDAFTIIENKPEVRTSRNKPVVSKVNTTISSTSSSPDVTAFTEIFKKLLLNVKGTQQAIVKDIEETCVICGGPHPYYECLPTGGNTFDAYAAVGPCNQEGNRYRPQGDLNYHARNQIGPPGFSPLNVQNSQNQNCSGIQVPTPELEVAPKPNPKPSIPYLLRLNDHKLCKKANNQMLKFLHIIQRLHFNISFANALLYMPMLTLSFQSHKDHRKSKEEDEMKMRKNLEREIN